MRDSLKEKLAGELEAVKVDVNKKYLEYKKVQYQWKVLCAERDKIKSFLRFGVGGIKRRKKKKEDEKPIEPLPTEPPEDIQSN